METYFKILQLHCNAKNIIYPEHNKCEKENFKLRQWYWDNSSKEKNSTLTHIYFFMDRLSKNYYENSENNENRLQKFIKHKHKLIFNELSSIFAKNTNLLEIIYKTQKTYNAFIKLAQIFRYSRTPQIAEDLLLCSINIKSKTTIKIYENNKLYLFTCNDLSNHIEICLSNCDSYFFTNPRQIKNPYSNTYFSKSTLMNIYMKLRSQTIKFPLLLHQLYLCEFDINKFRLENEYFIKDQYIKRMIYKPNTESLFKSMKQMVTAVTKTRLRIHDNIDKEEFIKIIRPYYYLYLTHCYHIYGLEKSYNSMNLLRKKITELYDYNPKFGRIYMKRVPMKKNTLRKISDLDHPKFTMNDVLTLERNTYIFQGPTTTREEDEATEDEATEDENEESSDMEEELNFTNNDAESIMSED